MNYYFTGVLIILMLLLATCLTPAHSKNNYLNQGGNTFYYGNIK